MNVKDNDMSSQPSLYGATTLLKRIARHLSDQSFLKRALETENASKQEANLHSIEQLVAKLKQ